ncbi:MAG: LamG domain-containing protein [Candidatus Poribacteria bacterium]|nr:LamG domain-containing protein [Candidatus Poribacteria bacterium]MDE0506283.1 LamG domain-containing protein [Candidatus Poribacteria bacterium]
MKMQDTVTLMLVILGTLVWRIDAALGRERAVSEGLISYWSFDQETIEGKTVKDVWGANNGKIEGDPKVVKGKIGEGMEFNGGNQSVNVGDPADGSLDFGARTDFTLEAWAFPKNTGSSMRIIDKKDGGDVGYMLEHNISDGFQPYANDGKGNASRVLEGMTRFEQWTHVVGVFERKGDVELFVNGESVRSVPSDSQGKENIDNKSPFYIGRRPGGERWKGILDEIRVYKRVLTEEEIKQNFEARGGLAHSVEISGKLAITWGRIKSSK